MGEIYLVRHGQASFGSDNYDQLSAMGARQATILGEHWRALALKLDAVFCGELCRQIDTAEKAMAAAVFDKKVQIVPELNEFTITPIVKAYEQQLKERDPPVETNWDELKGDRRATYRFLEAALRMWTRGDLKGPDIEPRVMFRQRCQRGLNSVIEKLGAGGTGAAFSSSGTISTIVSIVLGVDDDTAVGLELQMYNASVTRILYSGSRMTLASLNNIGHLEAQRDSALLSFI